MMCVVQSNDTKRVMDRRRKWSSSVLQKGEEHGRRETPFIVILAFLEKKKTH